MQIIHPYRHNTVIVCIFIPFDWQTETASLVSSLVIKKKKKINNKQDQSGLNDGPFHECGEIQKAHRCSPSSSEGTPHPKLYYVFKTYKSWLSVQMERAKFALGTSLGLRKKRLSKIAHEARGWKPPPCRELYTIPMQCFQKGSGIICSLLTWECLQTTPRQVNNEKVCPCYS